MAAPVKILVAGLPAELVREIGLRLRDVAVSEFENAQQMGRAAALKPGSASSAMRFPPQMPST